MWLVATVLDTAKLHSVLRIVALVSACAIACALTCACWYSRQPKLKAQAVF